MAPVECDRRRMAPPSSTRISARMKRVQIHVPPTQVQCSLGQHGVHLDHKLKRRFQADFHKLEAQGPALAAWVGLHPPPRSVCTTCKLRTFIQPVKQNKTYAHTRFICNVTYLCPCACGGDLATRPRSANICAASIMMPNPVSCRMCQGSHHHHFSGTCLVRRSRRLGAGVLW